MVAVAHEVLDAGVQFELLHVAAKVERETAVHLINALTDDQLDEIARRVTDGDMVSALLDLADKVDEPTLRRLVALNGFAAVRDVAMSCRLGDRFDAVTGSVTGL